MEVPPLLFNRVHGCTVLAAPQDQDTLIKQSYAEITRFKYIINSQ